MSAPVVFVEGDDVYVRMDMTTASCVTKLLGICAGDGGPTTQLYKTMRAKGILRARMINEPEYALKFGDKDD